VRAEGALDRTSPTFLKSSQANRPPVVTPVINPSASPPDFSPAFKRFRATVARRGALAGWIAESQGGGVANTVNRNNRSIDDLS
jgi:hypothetical protein